MRNSSTAAHHEGLAGRWQYTANILLRLAQLHVLTGVHLRQMWPWSWGKDLFQAVQGRSVTLQALIRTISRHLVLPRGALLGCSASGKGLHWGLVLGETVQIKWTQSTPRGCATSSWWFMFLAPLVAHTCGQPVLQYESIFPSKTPSAARAFQLIQFGENKTFFPTCFEGTREMPSSTMSYVILDMLHSFLAASCCETPPFGIRMT